MPRTAIIALSRQGAIQAARLKAALGVDCELFLDRRFVEQVGPEGLHGCTEFDQPLRPLFRRIWGHFEALVLFLPVGAAVRLAAPLLQDKKRDPALVCVDDAARFAVSVVSGHIGGADDLAQRVANALGAQAVVTSGSHVTETLAVDMVGRHLGWAIESDSTEITRASAAMVNREPVGFFLDAGEAGWWPPDKLLPGNITVHLSLESLSRSNCVAALIVSDRIDPFRALGITARDALPSAHVVIYRPRTLVAGMGCRRGVPAEEMERHLLDTLSANNLAVGSLSCLATATLKQDESGLIELAEKFNVPLRCFSAEELNVVFQGTHRSRSFGRYLSEETSPGWSEESVDTCGEVLHPSDNARRLVGVWGVAEPAALLASGSNSLLVGKQKAARSTVAVARVKFEDYIIEDKASIGNSQ